MNKEFPSRLPDIHSLDSDLASFIKYNAIRINGGEISSEDILQMSGIVAAAKKIGPMISGFRENYGEEGFIVAISKNDVLYPTLFVEIGYAGKKPKKFIEDANLKVVVIKENSGFTSSAQNLELPKKERMYSNEMLGIGGGALLFKNDWIVSISGFSTPHMNSVAALGTAIGSKLINFDGAITRARNEGMECLDLFVKYQDRLTKPFFIEINDRDEIPEEPHLDI